MKKVTVAFDVDGTLRCNCTDTCQDLNQRTLDGLYFMRHMKNVRIMVWSGGGVAYVEQFLNRHSIGTRSFCLASKLDPSTWRWGKPDIAVDDMQSCELGILNLIVREK
jgi:hypothetical protein